MWVFLDNSFVSAVEHNDDPSLLVVRARIAGDLERFFGVDVSAERHENRDYLFRAIVSKAKFANALSKHALEISYGNFKSNISHDDSNRYDAYNGVWSVMNDLQGRLYGVGRYVSRKYLARQARVDA